MKFSLQLITSFGLFLFPVFLSGQTYTIGTFNGQNTSTTYPTSYGDNMESTRSQFLYRASELSAAGVTAGNITKLGFNVIDVTGVGVHENYTVKLMLTTINALTAGAWEPGATTVFGPVDYTPVVGLNEHILSTPFYWDGNSNLIVEICHSADPANGGNYSSQNAVVELTTGLSFFGSRTRAKNNDNLVCNTAQMQEDGTPTSRPVLSLAFCYKPVTLSITGVTSVAATLGWAPPAGGSPAGYAWTFGLQGYIPGSAGTEIGSGTSTEGSAAIAGLEGLTTYSFWVRSDCGDGYSTWAGPLDFTTDPSCGDPFGDTGGPFGAYDINEDYQKVFCPDIPDNAISMDFTLPFSFSSGVGDTLKIYNGNSTDFPLLAELSGVYAVPPGPFVSTTSSGCLTIHFTSDEVKAPEDSGWLSFLLCSGLPTGECYSVLGLDTLVVSYNTATFSWIGMFGADSYEYELLLLPGQTVVHQNTAFQGTQISFNDLQEGSSYRFSVRTNCSNGEHSAWETIEFNTPVQCTGPFIQCGVPTPMSTSKTGLWNLTDCGGTTPGKEKIFRFLALNTKSYDFEVTAASGGYVSYFFKAASEGCNDANWHCIDDFNTAGASALPPIPGNTLTAGQVYYILADPQVTTPVSQTFKISACEPPVNDSPVNAIDIAVNSPCDDNIYSNIGAGLDPGEPDPDVDPSDGLVGRWLDAADETVWFTFTAPPTGTITIFTNPKSADIPNNDTQVALYSVGDPSDYSTFHLLVSDEDNGSAYLGYNSVVSYTGLNAGQTYYIQVDGWGINHGVFCISVTETVEAVTQANCDADYTVENVSGDSWFGIYATPDDLDIGPLAAAINPNDYDLGTVTCRVQTYDEIPVSGNGIPYMPVYYHFTSSLAPAGDVLIRLFYTDPDFADLKTAASAPDNTIQDLVISRFNGTVSDCEQLNNNGPSTILSVDYATQMVGTFYLEFSTHLLGEFGAHFGLVPLPLKLKFFTGKVLDKVNRLEWTTLQEKNVQWHIVERSADGINWSEAGRLPGQADSGVPRNYALDDVQPPVKAYYRLRSVDFDGLASVSQSILLSRRTDQFGIAGVFPTPTSDRLTVQFISVQEEDISIRLTDFTGRVVLEESVSATKGINSHHLSLGNLPAGVYNITLADEGAVSEPFRVVKQ